MLMILYVLAIALGFLAAMLLPPVLVALSFDETFVAELFIINAGLLSFLAGGLIIALRGHSSVPSVLFRYQAILCIWIVLPIISALPIKQATGMPFMLAVFESVSAFTTSGATLFKVIDNLPKSIIFWRIQMQWLGGLLTLLTIVFVIAPLSLGGLPARRMPLVNRHAKIDGATISKNVFQIIFAFSVLTAICAVLLMMAGLPSFDALCIAMSTLSTGGLMPRDGDISIYSNPLAEIILILFMFIGATSILWHRMIIRRQWFLLRMHRESGMIALLIGALGIIYAGILFEAAGSITVLHPLQALREGIFTATSLITTTGFDSRSAGLTVLPVTVILFFALVGAGTYSTSGGLKLFRIGAMFTSALQEINNLIYPHGISRQTYGEQTYDINLMKSMWSFFIAATFVIVITSIFITFEGLNIEAAALMAIGAFSNVTQIYTSGWPEGAQWPDFIDLSSRTRIILMITMVLGRIEILIFLGALGRRRFL